MRKKFLSALLSALTISTASILPMSSIVSAENSKAAEIREIFSSQKYYLE